jgi:PadR family transcriptional regulator PadR
MNKDNVNEKIDKWQSQVRKGMLDFIILIFLSQKEFYGYELIKAIKETAEINISEGTIYPLLSRLKKEQSITAKWVEMETGIPRKYYRITDRGKIVLTGMKESWKQFSLTINQLMEEK